MTGSAAGSSSRSATRRATRPAWAAASWAARPRRDDGESRGPKYLNSPATLLFDKSRTLYLIDRAKGAIRKHGTAVLVEGNTDALMAHQQGFDNVVGTLGTALTAAQIELVTRYAPRIALAYDVDAAGQGAATFGATRAVGAGGRDRSAARIEGRLTDVGVVRLPDGKDPDEVMRDDAGRVARSDGEAAADHRVPHRQPGASATTRARWPAASSSSQRSCRRCAA